MIRQRKIELLAPAKNLECGIAAVDHGADAIYIGAPRFGARAAAGNSLEDIAELVRYAHVYNVRIYVTVNTILKDEELKDTEKMIWDLYRAGVDALIVQDMGLLELNLPPIPLHASTQMDNRTSQKVRFLAEAGFRQVVLARELSLVEIENIHHACPDVPLEVFVHGALCVSYSGQCYVSQACFGRSANRGECAQFCRLAFDMIDADGKSIVRNKHLLSLKDLNQSEELEQLLDAGASSLKIEGRLKDVSYVKNVTAYYRQKLDTIFKRRKEYIRASSGEVKLEFKPQLDKSFSRGFTMGPNTISRENVKRKIVISANTSGRDLRSVVNDIQERIDAQIKLPEGYHVEYGGQFESEQAASRTLMLTSFMSIVVIFLLLYTQFKNAAQSGVILLNLPLALIGGVFALMITTGEISIPAIIGFISLFGIATRNGMLLISHYNTLREEGMDLKESILHGSLDRLNPILMTALSSALALIPLAFRGDLPGNEIQSPMAKVILGGLLTSTFLNAFIIPIVYELMNRKKK